MRLARQRWSIGLQRTTFAIIVIIPTIMCAPQFTANATTENPVSAGAGWIIWLMPPAVTGAIVALIGLNLAPVV